MKTKWVVVGILSFAGIVLFGSGAAPLIFSEMVYGCNLQESLASGDIEPVSNHPITMAYNEKYELNSLHTSGTRSLEWGHGTVEYSSYYDTEDRGLSNAYLKVTVDSCGVPTEFKFQCVDSENNPWVSLNSKDDYVLDYLQNKNCFGEKTRR